MRGSILGSPILGNYHVGVYQKGGLQTLGVYGDSKGNIGSPSKIT